LFKALLEHAVLSIGAYELAPGAGIFAILDFHQVDVSLVQVGSELIGAPDLGQRLASCCCCWEPLIPSAPCPTSWCIPRGGIWYVWLLNAGICVVLFDTLLWHLHTHYQLCQHGYLLQKGAQGLVSCGQFVNSFSRYPLAHGGGKFQGTAGASWFGGEMRDCQLQLWVAVKDGGYWCRNFSSADNSFDAHSTWFYKLGVEVAGWYVPAPDTFF